MIKIFTDAQGHTYTVAEGSDVVLVAAYGRGVPIALTRDEARAQWAASRRVVSYRPTAEDLEAGRRSLHGW